MNGAKSRVWVLNNKLKRSLRDFELRAATFGNLWKSSEHLRESLAMFGSCRKFSGNSGKMDTKISRI